jgi:hypothetical protein
MYLMLIAQIQDGGQLMRIIAKHIPSKIGIPTADRSKRDELYSVTGDKKGGRS